MRNKILYILLILVATLFIPSCMSANYGFHIPENSRDQFVRILQQVQISICVEEGCTSTPMKSSGSGAVVSESLRGSYILTAGHVCELEIDRIIPPELIKNINRIDINMIIVNLAQSKYNAEIIAIDQNSDLCLMFSKGYWNESGAVDMADVKPFEGERVYNVAAPVGIFYENVVPLLEGFYMGRKQLRAYYSIPAMGGSSGN
jgi:S1-C subfamily serine protease